MVDYSVPSLTKRALRSNLHVSGGLTAPTCRPDGFADYQDARDFDAELCEQLEVSPQLVSAAALPAPRRKATKPMIFSRPRSPERGAGAVRPPTLSPSGPRRVRTK